MILYIFFFFHFRFPLFSVKRLQMSKIECCLLGHPENKSSTWVVYLLLLPLLFLSFLNYAAQSPLSHHSTAIAISFPLLVAIVVAAAFVVYAFGAECACVCV